MSGAYRGPCRRGVQQEIPSSTENLPLATDANPTDDEAGPGGPESREKQCKYRLKRRIEHCEHR